MSTPAGVLEIQILAGLARLSDDMRRAEKVVGDSTGKMEKSVISLQSQFAKLGMGLSIGLMIDQARRMTDSYTKVTAQLRIATSTQAEYAKGMEDVRRISTSAQAGIEATTMLYTRLTNSLKQHGATQQDVSRITESVSLGLKAYGATTVEAASAMLQLSQAFGSGRLGGEEFRAVSEAMPNMMAILAKSMNVPKSALRELSMEGKITTEVMAKAWSNPAIIADLLKQAELTRTITGEVTVFRNNMTMLVGTLMDTSGGTRSITSAIHALSDAVIFLEKNLETVVSILTAYLGYLALVKVQQAITWTQSRLLIMANTATLAADAAAAIAHAAVISNAAAAETLAKKIQRQADIEALLATEASIVASIAAARTTEIRAAAELKLAGILGIKEKALAEAIAMDRAYTLQQAAGTAAAETRTAALAASSVAAIRWGTSVSAAITMIGTSVSAAMLANPIGAAVLAILAITAAIINWETVVKASKATFDFFGNIIDALQFGAQAASIKLGQFFAVLITYKDLIAGNITNAQAKSMFASIKDDAEKQTVALIKLEQTQIYHAAVAEQQKYAADSAAWNKLTNNKAQQRQAEIDSLNEDYLKRIAGQEMNQAAMLESAARYNYRLSEINDKYAKEKSVKSDRTWLDKMGEELTASNASTTAQLTNLEKLNLAIKQNAKVRQEHFTEEQVRVLVEEADLKDAAEAHAKAYSEMSDAGMKEIEGIEKAIKAQEQHNAEIGKTPEQIALIRAEIEQREIDELRMYSKAIRAAIEYAGVEKDIYILRANQLDDEVARMEKLQKLKADAAPREAAAKEIADANKANEHMWKEYDKWGKQAFDSIFNKGENVFKSLGQMIKRYLIDVLYRMSLQKFLINVGIIGGTTAAGSAAAMDGGESSTGVGGWLSIAKTAYKAINGTVADEIANGFARFATSNFGQSLGLSSITTESLGASQALSSLTESSVEAVAVMNETGMAWSAGLQAIGDAAAGYMLQKTISGEYKIGSGKIVDALTLVASAWLGPVAGIIGGIANRAFGRKPIEYQDTKLVGQFGSGGFAGQYETPWTQKGGWFRSNKSGTDITALTENQQTAFNAITAGTKTVFDSLLLASGEATKSIDGWSFAIDRQVSNQEQQNLLIIDVANSMGTYMIPSLVDFQREGENLADTAIRMKDTFIITNAILDLVGGSFGAVGLASMGMRSNLIDLLGGLQSANASMQSYYQNFYSDAERTANGWDLMNSSLATLGVTSLPTTNEGFRALVESQDLSTESGRQLFASLIKLSPAFNDLTSAGDALAAVALERQHEIETANRGWTDRLTLAQAQAISPEQVIFVEHQIALRDATDDSTRSLMEQTWAQEALNDASAAAAKVAEDAAVKAAALIETNKGWQDQIDILTGKETDRSIALRDAEDESTRELMRRVYALQDEAAAIEKANAVSAQRFNLEIQYAQLSGDNTLARIAELQALDVSNRALQLRIWTLQGEQAEAEQSAGNLAEAYREASSAQNNYLKGLISFGGSIKDFLRGLDVNVATAPTPQAALAAAQAQYQADLVAAQGGDVEAQGRLASTSQTYIDLARDVFGSGGQFSAILGQIRTDLGGLDVVTQYDANLAALKAIETAVISSGTAIQTSYTAASETIKFAIKESDLLFTDNLATQFNRLDRDGSGGLTSLEFHSGLAGKASEATIKALFNLTDTNHDGLISQQEANAVSMGELIRLTDLNGDGIVSAIEASTAANEDNFDRWGTNYNLAPGQYTTNEMLQFVRENTYHPVPQSLGIVDAINGLKTEVSELKTSHGRILEQGNIDNNNQTERIETAINNSGSQQARAASNAALLQATA